MMASFLFGFNVWVYIQHSTSAAFPLYIIYDSPLSCATGLFSNVQWNAQSHSFHALYLTDPFARTPFAIDCWGHSLLSSILNEMLLHQRLCWLFFYVHRWAFTNVKCRPPMLRTCPCTRSTTGLLEAHLVICNVRWSSSLNPNSVPTFKPVNKECIIAYVQS